MGRLCQMPTQQPGFWRRDEVVLGYCRITGRIAGDFLFYWVLALFRSAIVFLQLFGGWRRDPIAHSRCANFGALGRELLDYALAVARESG